MAEVIEGKHSLPITVQWLRAIEAQVGGLDWYAPSLLFEIAAAFQGHISGAISSKAEQHLDDLERRAKQA